jgi:BRCT domain type II-containing protein
VSAISDAASKLDKARELGVNVIDEEEMKGLVSEILRILHGAQDWPG